MPLFLNRLSKRLLFSWITFISLSLVSVFIACKLFLFVFPISNLTLTTSRSDILSTAKQLALQHDWFDSDYLSAISFETDTQLKDYIELKAGGLPAFQSIINDSVYAPYYWQVRHFQEAQESEHFLFFDPSGLPIGFSLTLPETLSLPNTDAPTARATSQALAQSQWNIPMTDYTLIDSSSKQQPSGRIDHSFTYEHLSYHFNDAKLRLTLSYSGNRFSKLVSFFYIPDGFFQDFQHIRSFNDTLAQIALFLMIFLYVFCIAGISGYHYLKTQFFIIKPALKWSVFLGILSFSLTLNQLPLLWMNYDTALSRFQFLWTLLSTGFFQLLVLILFIFALFLISEAISRQAFPHAIQFWKLWTHPISTSSSIINHYLIGYFIVGFQLLYVVLFYYISSHFFDWWIPSSTLVSPNILATTFPWLEPFVNALSAGFIEECLFRALPLSAAVIVGRKFNCPKRCLFIGFLVQALIFGAAHANYPALPFYARLFELIIPSILFGVLFIKLGLLPAIISHFVFDFILMSLPIFFTQTSHNWVNISFVVFLFFSPLIVPFFTYFRHQKITTTLPQTAFNHSWSPPISQDLIQKPIPSYSIPISRLGYMGIGCVMALGLFFWLFFTSFQPQIPPQLITSKQAKQIATEYLKSEDLKSEDLTSHFLTDHTLSLDTTTVLARHFQSGTKLDHFIWEQGQQSLLDTLLNRFISPQFWVVRFVTFKGSLLEKGNEHLIYINHLGTVFRHHHKLHETASSVHLTEEDAQSLAYASFSSTPFLLQDFTLIKHSSTKHPNRTDWHFIFNEKHSALTTGETRLAITISGNQVSDFVSSIFIPEHWDRSYRRSQLFFHSIIKFLKTFEFLALIVISCFCLLSLFSHTRHRTRPLNTSLFFVIFFSLFSIQCMHYFLNFPSIFYWLTPFKPISHQLFSIMAFPLLNTLFSSALLSLLLYWILHKPLPLLRPTSSRLFGVMFGLILAGASAILYAYSSRSAPLFGRADYIHSFVPILGPLLRAIPTYLMQTSLFMIVLTFLFTRTQHFTVKKWLAIPSFLFLGFYFIDPTLDYSLLTWLFSILIFSLISIIGFWYILHKGFNCIPILMSTLYLLEFFQEALFFTYPGSFLAYSIAGLGIMVLGYALHQRLTLRFNF